MYANTRRPEAFLREMEAYERDLPLLQGDIIPKCFGLVQALIDNIDGKVSSFLILKYSGTPIDCRNKYSEEFIMHVINKLTTLHQYGFQHGDFEDHNILIDNGKAMFIDLEDLQPHKCELKQCLIFDDLQPGTAEFGCREIYHAAYMFGVWQEPCVKFYGKVVYLPFIVRGAAKYLVNRAQYTIDDEEKALQEAEKSIGEIETWREWYNTITDEDRHFEFNLDPKDAGNPYVSASDSGSHSEDSSAGSTASRTDAPSPPPSGTS